MPTLVHELPQRLRFRLPLLGEPRTDIAYLQAYLAAIPGVTTVDINPRATCVVFEYDGELQTRNAIIASLTGVDIERLPSRTGPLQAPTVSKGDVVAKTFSTLLLPFLPAPAQAVITYLSISSTLLKGLDALINEGLKVEVLDAIAVGLSAGRREYLTANVTQWLLTLGEYMEASTAQRSEALLAELLKPRITEVWVERDGHKIKVGSDQIRPGEILVLGPGDAIPVDGYITEGIGMVNQASLTGESVPVRREVDAAVLSGTLVEDGHIKVRAERVGDQTTTARITSFIRESLQQRSTTQQITAEMADRRVLITLIVGVLVFVLTHKPRRVASVFLVDYSCALKLSIPVSFKSSMYRAARSGVLLKGGQAIEELAQVDTVVFDKTGTLSHGQLEVTDVISLYPEQYDDQHLLAVAASVEEHALHPVAEAVVIAAKRQDLRHIDHGEVEYLVAHGLRTHVNQLEVLIGSRHFLEEHESVDFSDNEDRIRHLEAEGKMLLFVSRHGKLFGIIALRDRLRAEVNHVLKRLRASGIKSLVLLTGDRKPKARAMGDALEMDTVYAEKAPEDKADVVETLRRQGRRVAFVGDGVNDAPGLVAADVGIAMPRGAEIARQGADVVLLEDRLDGVADARELALETMKLVKHNITLTEVINTGIMVGAAFGWLSPITTAVLHNSTTIGILLRALAGVSTPVSRSAQSNMR